MHSIPLRYSKNKLSSCYPIYATISFARTPTRYGIGASNMSISSFGNMAMCVCTHRMGQRKYGKLFTTAEMSVISSVFIFFSLSVLGCIMFDRPTTMKDFSRRRHVKSVSSWPAGSCVSSSEKSSGVCHSCPCFRRSPVFSGRV
jgi:hypothetical protein